MANEYENDFTLTPTPITAYTLIAPAAWEDQAVVLPLGKYVGMCEDNVRYTMRISALSKECADLREQLRHKENEVASLRGDIDAMLAAAEGGE